jgi:hypothetical protein
MRNALFFILLILTACQSEHNFEINGQLPDKTYDGEVIYLVPMENAAKERVDSTIIKNREFHFKGFAKIPEIYVIRAKPVLRYNLEELLLVREPGELTVTIDKKSSVRGTQLNDSLQYWKERKMSFDFVNAELVKQFRVADEASKPEIQQRADSLHVDAINFHFHFVLNNKNSIVGQFVQKIMSSSFTAEQKKKLDIK